MRLDLEPTKGVANQGTVKRPPHNLINESGEIDDDEDDDDVAEIGTHRKNSLQGSTHEMTAVNRFNTASKDQSINQSQDNMLEQRMSPVNPMSQGHHVLSAAMNMNVAGGANNANMLQHKSDTGLPQNKRGQSRQN